MPHDYMTEFVCFFLSSIYLRKCFHVAPPFTIYFKTVTTSYLPVRPQSSSVGFVVRKHSGGQEKWCKMPSAQPLRITVVTFLIDWHIWSKEQQNENKNREANKVEEELLKKVLERESDEVYIYVSILSNASLITNIFTSQKQYLLKPAEEPNQEAERE